MWDGYLNFVSEKACGLARLVRRVACADGVKGFRAGQRGRWDESKVGGMEGGAE